MRVLYNAHEKKNLKKQCVDCKILLSSKSAFGNALVSISCLSADAESTRNFGEASSLPGWVTGRLPGVVCRAGWSRQGLGKRNTVLHVGIFSSLSLEMHNYVLLLRAVSLQGHRAFGVEGWSHDDHQFIDSASSDGHEPGTTGSGWEPKVLGRSFCPSKFPLPVGNTRGKKGEKEEFDTVTRK